MVIFDKVDKLRADLAEVRKQGYTIGFVPTMGALHEGHISLIKLAKEHCHRVVCSIFVNPTQFNNPSDFDRYPRNTDLDMHRLQEADCDILFLPTEKEIYPDDSARRYFDPGKLGETLEGAHRPGHFKGVIMVVRRLLEIVEPDKAFFGQKDYQQLLIVRKLVEHYGMNTEIIAGDIIREKSGLAMSSRNQLLSEDDRERALVLSNTLNQARKMASGSSPEEVRKWARNRLENAPGVDLEYFEIADANSLQPVGSFSNGSHAVALVAAWVGGVRLIDNLPFNK